MMKKLTREDKKYDILKSEGMWKQLGIDVNCLDKLRTCDEKQSYIVKSFLTNV